MSLNKENIIELIQRPNTISAEHLDPLKKLLDEYPFSSTLHTLYLKGLKNTKDFAYDQQLTQASIHVPSRERLYEVIIQEQLRQAISDTLEEEKHEKTEPAVNEEKPVEPAIKPIIIDETDAEEIIDKPKKEDEKTTSSENIDALEETILSEIASYNIEEISPSNEAKSVEKPQQKAPEKQSFTAWLHPNKTDKSKDIIDSFIAQNPSITPNKSDVYSAPNMAKMSLADDDGFVTETLARVYMKQGHFDKAIKTYEKLSLKIPEKSTFFASQIEVIQELKKQQQ